MDISLKNGLCYVSGGRFLYIDNYKLSLVERGGNRDIPWVF